MLHVQLITGTLAVFATVILHVSGLVMIWVYANRHPGLTTANATPSQTIFSFASVVLAILVLHIFGVWFWAVLYMLLGEFSVFTEALYFSSATATTLGYGDITLSADWRLMGTFEAMGGMILFGVSTAFLMQYLRRLWGTSISSEG